MRRTLVAGVVAAALVGVSGCGADEPRPKIAEPTAPPTSTATGSPSAGPSDDPEADLEPPELSDEARQPTLDGAVAFTNYYWATVNYAQQTGDTTTLRELVSPFCDSCQAGIDFIERFTKPGNAIRGGNLAVLNPSAEDISTGGRTGFSVTFSTRNTAQSVVRQGRVIERYRAETVSSQFLLQFRESAWRVDIWKVNA